MINLNKTEAANSKYRPGVVYLTAPRLDFAYKVKDAFAFLGSYAEPEVRLSIVDGPVRIAARRMNIRSRFSDYTQTMTLDADVEDLTLDRAVDAFARRWFDLADSTVGNIEISLEEALSTASPTKVKDSREKMLEEVAKVLVMYVLKFHKMPPISLLTFIGTEPLGTGKLSDIVIDSDTNILLPSFSVKPMALNPLQRTVYMLFVRHPEGIVLLDIDSYRNELEDIYYVVKKSATAEMTKKAIEHLCDPLDGTLHQQLSRIKQKLLQLLGNKKLADAYAIQGRRGEPYRIAALSDPDVCLHLPSWLKESR